MREGDNLLIKIQNKQHILNLKGAVKTICLILGPKPRRFNQKKLCGGRDSLSKRRLLVQKVVQAGQPSEARR